jgi:hypothetical protein
MIRSGALFIITGCGLATFCLVRKGLYVVLPRRTGQALRHSALIVHPDDTLHKRPAAASWRHRAPAWSGQFPPPLDRGKHQAAHALCATDQLKLSWHVGVTLSINKDGCASHTIPRYFA